VAGTPVKTYVRL